MVRRGDAQREGEREETVKTCAGSCCSSIAEFLQEAARMSRAAAGPRSPTQAPGAL